MQLIGGANVGTTCHVPPAGYFKASARPRYFSSVVAILLLWVFRLLFSKTRDLEQTLLVERTFRAMHTRREHKILRARTTRTLLKINVCK